MKLVIDELISNTSWTTSDGTKVVIPTENQVAEYIANDNSKSLMIRFLASSSGAYVQKTFTAIDVTDYDELTINIQSSRLFGTRSDFNSVDDYNYQIDFNDSMDDFMLPGFSILTPITFNISGITSIDRIRITSNTTSADYLTISHCVALKDELPLDIFKAVKSRIETIITERIEDTIQIGIVTGTAGDTSIEIEASGSYLRDYVEKYTVIHIDDGVNSEEHLLMENDEVTYQLGSFYDGLTLQNSYTNAAVYLYFPVEYCLKEEEIRLPGIHINGMPPRPFLRGGEIENVYDTYTENGAVDQRLDDMLMEWNILIDCESRNNDLIALMSECVRIAIGRKYLWLNGKVYNIYFLDNPVYIDAVQGYNQIPKIQYSMRVETKETIWQRTTEPKTTTLTATYTIQT